MTPTEPHMTPERLAEIEAKLDPAARKLADGDSLCCGWAEAYDQDIPALIEEVRRLRAIVDKLPKTADGVTVVPGDVVWMLAMHGGVEGQPAELAVWETEVIDQDTDSREQTVCHSIAGCYSTSEAAEAAKEGAK